VHRELGHLTSESGYVPHPVQAPRLANASQKHPTVHIILHVAARRAHNLSVRPI